MLEQIFLQVVDMSMTASIIILIVSIVRILLKRFPKYLSYMLWVCVLFRLLCPVTFESKISPIPELDPVFDEYLTENEVVSIDDTLEETSVLYTENDETNVLNTHTTHIQSNKNSNIREEKVSLVKLGIKFGKYVWLLGLGVMLLYSLISLIKIRRKTLISICLKDNIYIIDMAVAPFVMGIFIPKIYLPEGLGEKEQKFIISHEQFHIKRFDHIAKLIAYIAFCIHWFNPLVWMAFALFCKDMEMSCDEAVIKQMGESIKADYATSILALSTRHHIIQGVPVAFVEGDVKGRIKNLLKLKRINKGVLFLLISVVIILVVCLVSNRESFITVSNNPNDEIITSENTEMTDIQEDSKQLDISLNIKEYYITHTGDPSNLYYIDENNILWGSGRNEYGQLGQGTQDYEFYSDKIKIADNVIHVDYSQKGFTIFLTEDNKLYGMGNAGTGALQQYGEFDWTRYTDGEQYTVTTPILLMENVVYVRCGRDDIVCQKEDGTVWTWGTIGIEDGYLSNNVYFIEKPKKILENAVLVTGGWFNHAALLQDGTVWTWGDNSAGNCGVADLPVVSEPMMVAEDVAMVWTDLAVDGYPQPNEEDVAMAWTGKLKYNSMYDNIAEFNDIYPEYLNNTVIRKIDGSYWVCGENVGIEEKVVHGAEGDYSVNYTHEFYACE